MKLQSGLDQKKASGFSQNVNVLDDLKKENPEGYEEVCYEIGNSFLFYYDINVDRDRYSNAAKWFKPCVDQYVIAGIYCDIANCLELINQYNGSKIKQTEKMYEEYGKLWNMIKELKSKADDFDSVDSKLQVWNEINGSAFNEARGKLTDKISPSGQLQRQGQSMKFGIDTSKISTQELEYEEPSSETTVLSANETSILEPSAGETSVLSEGPGYGETSVLTPIATGTVNGVVDSVFAIEYEIIYIHTNEIIEMEAVG